MKAEPSTREAELRSRPDDTRAERPKAREQEDRRRRRDEDERRGREEDRQRVRDEPMPQAPEPAPQVTACLVSAQACASCIANALNVKLLHSMRRGADPCNMTGLLIAHSNLGIMTGSNMMSVCELTLACCTLCTDPPRLNL